MANGHGLQHLNKRRPWKNVFDRFMYFVAIAYPLSTAPQIIQIYTEKSAEGVSVSTWILYLFFATCWLTYGLIHKEKPIVISNTLWVTMYILVVLETFVY